MAKRHSNRVGSLESLFLRLEELVLANSGEDEFEEIFKLLIAKLWDEQGEKARFRVHETQDETYRAVVGLLREAELGWPGVLDAGSRPLLTPEHLQVCVDALSRHTVSDAGLSVLDSFFEFLVSRTAKGAKGQFFTPRYVIEFCVRMLRPGREETVLDPACGSGGFLIHTLNLARREYGLVGESLRRYADSRIWGFDLDARAVRVAKALMLLAGGGSANLFRLNSLLTPNAGSNSLFAEGRSDTSLTVEDVCRSRMRRHKGFDVILTNPPFAGEVRERDVLEDYRLARGRDRVERDVLFLERCVDLLRPGGRMAVVLPHNKFATAAFGYLREWLLRKVRILAVVGLGRNTFLPHTHQKASILFAQKNESGAKPAEDANIFFAVSERDGKNSKGQTMPRRGAASATDEWERVDHDLDEVVSRFRDFCRVESLVMGG